MTPAERETAVTHLDQAITALCLDNENRALGYLQEAAELFGFDLKPLLQDASNAARVAMAGEWRPTDLRDVLPGGM